MEAVRTLDPIADAQRIIDIFEVSTPVIQKSMIKAFATPIVSIEGFPEDTFEMRDGRTGGLLVRVINIEEGE